MQASRTIIPLALLLTLCCSGVSAEADPESDASTDAQPEPEAPNAPLAEDGESENSPADGANPEVAQNNEGPGDCTPPAPGAPCVETICTNSYEAEDTGLVGGSPSGGAGVYIRERSSEDGKARYSGFGFAPDNNCPSA